MMGSGQVLGKPVPPDRQQQLAELRRRMAAIPARGVEATRHAPLSAAISTAAPRRRPTPTGPARTPADEPTSTGVETAAETRWAATGSPSTWAGSGFDPAETRVAQVEADPSPGTESSPAGPEPASAGSGFVPAGSDSAGSGSGHAELGSVSTEASTSAQVRLASAGSAAALATGSAGAGGVVTGAESASGASEFGSAGVRSRASHARTSARGVGVVERRELLPVPPALVDLLPEGGLAKGSIVSYSGASSLLSGLLAAVTGAGGHAAAVGLPRLGLLAAAEMGAQLARLAVVADPGPDPLEVASVLLDGLDLVVLGLNGASVPPSRARVLSARARSKSSTLVVTNGTWAGPSLRIDTKIAGYDGLGRGCGRLRTVSLDVRIGGRSMPPRHGHLDMFPRDGRVEWAARDTPLETLRPANHAVS